MSGEAENAGAECIEHVVYTRTRRCNNFIDALRLSNRLVLLFTPHLRSNRSNGIAAEFREKAKLTDPVQVRHSIEVALRGLDTMAKYTQLEAHSTAWTVKLEEDPLGAGEAERRATGTAKPPVSVRESRVSFLSRLHA